MASRMGWAKSATHGNWGVEVALGRGDGGIFVSVEVAVGVEVRRVVLVMTAVLVEAGVFPGLRPLGSAWEAAGDLWISHGKRRARVTTRAAAPSRVKKVFLFHFSPGGCGF